MSLTPHKTPPRKQPGQGLGHRKSDGLLLDVRTGAMLGDSEKKACALMARRLEQWINERVPDAPCARRPKIYAPGAVNGAAGQKAHAGSRPA
jgi:hypothetical protein